MEKQVKGFGQLKNSNCDIFWGEIAPCDHLVQVYENDQAFLNTLESFAREGLLAGDSVVIIATAAHIAAINERLEVQGFNLIDLISTDRYIPLDAEEELAKFMFKDWPDEKLFNRFVTTLINQAQASGRKVRAFGEMVAILWEQGNEAATVQLEKLWHQIHSKDQFSLYCAYPETGFGQCSRESVGKICSLHSKIIDGQLRQSTEIFYRQAG